MKCQAERLSKPQRRHLLECLEFEEEHHTTCYWTPRPIGEQRTARVLMREGLVERTYNPAWRGWDTYELTEVGRKLARGIRSNGLAIS